MDGLLINLKRFNNTYFQIFLVGHTQWRADLQDALLDIHTNNDGIVSVEDSIRDYLEGAREHGILAAGVHSFVLALFDIFSETIEQVIDDFGGEDLDSFFLGEGVGLWGDPYIKSKNCCKLLLDFALVFLIKNFLRLLHIGFMNGTDGDVGNWDLHILQELQEGLK